MVKKKDDAQSGSHPQPQLHHHARARRRLMAALATGGTVAVTGKVAPETWNAPILESVILPVHARTSLDPCCSEASALSCSAANIRENDITVTNGPFVGGGGPYMVDGFNCANASDLTLDVTAALSPAQSQQCGPIEISFSGNLQDDSDDGQGMINTVNSGQSVEIDLDCFSGEPCLFGSNSTSEDLQITFSHPCAADCVISFTFYCSNQ